MFMKNNGVIGCNPTMLLKNKGLLVIIPSMCMKTKDEESENLEDPTMLLKIK